MPASMLACRFSVLMFMLSAMVGSYIASTSSLGKFSNVRGRDDPGSALVASSWIRLNFEYPALLDFKHRVAN